MTMSTSTPTVGLSGVATIAAMPAMAISTAQVGGVTITRPCEYRGTRQRDDDQLRQCVRVNARHCRNKSTARGEGQMLVMSG